jgi:hypothetical protein
MRYSLTMINKNGYTIKREGSSIEGLKRQARFFPLESFFAYVYDKNTDNIICQNDYTKRFFKCDNKSFRPYWC